MAPSNQSKSISSVSQKELVIERKEGEIVPESEGPRPNSKGIVEAKFLENIPEFVGSRDVADCVAALQDLHSRYKYLESQLTAQKEGLVTKIPDIESALNLVKFLINKREKTIEDSEQQQPDAVILILLGLGMG